MSCVLYGLEIYYQKFSIYSQKFLTCFSSNSCVLVTSDLRHLEMCHWGGKKKYYELLLLGKSEFLPTNKSVWKAELSQCLWTMLSEFKNWRQVCTVGLEKNGHFPVAEHRPPAQIIYSLGGCWLLLVQPGLQAPRGQHSNSRLRAKGNCFRRALGMICCVLTSAFVCVFFPMCTEKQPNLYRLIYHQLVNLTLKQRDDRNIGSYIFYLLLSFSRICIVFCCCCFVIDDQNMHTILGACSNTRFIVMMFITFVRLKPLVVVNHKILYGDNH